ncbi:hypothetical protein CKO23_15355 [Thiocystis violacea]|nr:hypothetical protein [Thiocystis violacea]
MANEGKDMSAWVAIPNTAIRRMDELGLDRVAAEIASHRPSAAAVLPWICLCRECDRPPS